MITREFNAAVKRVDNKDVHIPITCTLSYDAGTDPYAVQAILQVSQEEDRVWHFSRELLGGLTQDAGGLFAGVGVDDTAGWWHGQGDVKFRYLASYNMVLMCLRSPEGHADIALPAAEVWGFLEDTEAAANITEANCTALVNEFLKELFDA